MSNQQQQGSNGQRCHFPSTCPMSLATALRDNDAKDLLVIDVRGLRPFAEAHIQGALTVRLSKLLMRRLNRGRISIDDVIVDRDNLWKNRSTSGMVVCYDDGATEEDVALDASDPLHVIMRSLFESNINALFLSGGFSVFSASYPDLIQKRANVGSSGSGSCLLSTLSVVRRPLAHPCGSEKTQQQKHEQGFPSTPACHASAFDLSALTHPMPETESSCDGMTSNSSSSGTSSNNDSDSEGSPSRQQLAPAAWVRPLATFSLTQTFHQAPHRRPMVRATPLHVSSPCPTAQYNSVMEAPVSRVRDYLFIGAMKDAANKELLEQLGITRIINVTRDVENHFEQDPRFSYLQIQIADSWNQKLQEKFPKAFEFIDEARRRNERVLVHCKAGVSRSAAVVIGYLMYSENLSLEQAHVDVRSKREIISPNLDFMGELKEYESALRSVLISS